MAARAPEPLAQARPADTALHALARVASDVARTLGPGGRCAVIGLDSAGPHARRDGVVLAFRASFPECRQNIGARILREVAVGTAEQAGDGTATSIVLAAAMIGEGLECLRRGLPGDSLRQGMRFASSAACARLHELSRPCTSHADLAGVASLAADGDAFLAEAVVTTLRAAGGRSRVAVEDVLRATAGPAPGGMHRHARSRVLLAHDAVNAARAALASGVVPGGGVAYLRAREALQGLSASAAGEQAGIEILRRTLDVPLRHIVMNAGGDPVRVLGKLASAAGLGYDAATWRFADASALSVLDPLKVSRVALENAALAASLVIGDHRLLAALR